MIPFCYFQKLVTYTNCLLCISFFFANALFLFVFNTETDEQ
jgi:hypothetical protein